MLLGELVSGCLNVGVHLIGHVRPENMGKHDALKLRTTTLPVADQTTKKFGKTERWKKNQQILPKKK